MKQPSRKLWPRNSYGFIGVKHLVLIVIVFGVYTGYKFVPVSFTKSRITHVVDVALNDTTHLWTDDGLRKMIVRTASTGSLGLEESQITVQKETRPGERIVHIDVQYPMSISYLGSERTVNANVYVAKVFKVNEAAEVRRIENEKSQAEERRRQLERQERFASEVKDAFAECTAKHGPGGCELTYGYSPGARPGQLERRY